MVVSYRRGLIFSAAVLSALISTGCDHRSKVAEPRIEDFTPGAAETTEAGLTRYTYYEARYRTDSPPVAVTYFGKDGRPTNPFDDIHMGMTKKQVIAILGDPYIDHDDDPFGYMSFRKGYGLVVVTYDLSGRIVKIESGP